MTTSTYATTTDPIAGELVQAIEAIWSRAQDLHPEVPDVFVTISAGRKGTRMLNGHFAPERWIVNGQPQHELLVGGEQLKRGTEDVFLTVLHEGAHGLAQTRGIKDTSRYGRYHNKQFRDLAAELGITVLNTVDGEKCRHGWTGDHAPADGTAQLYRDQLATLDAALRAHRIDEGHTQRPSSNNGYACECSCTPKPRRIRVSIGTYDEGPICCGVCTMPFIAED